VKRIPIKVIEDDKVYIINQPDPYYHCVAHRCAYKHINKATMIGHLRMMHDYTDAEAIVTVNQQRRDNG